MRVSAGIFALLTGNADIVEETGKQITPNVKINKRNLCPQGSQSSK